MKAKHIPIALIAAILGCQSPREGRQDHNPYSDVNFTVRNSSITLARLDSIVVPQVSFQDARIDDVIRWLEEFSTRNERLNGKEGIRYLACLGDYPLNDIPPITFTAKDVSLLDVIKTTAAVAGLDYIIYDTDLLEFRNSNDRDPNSKK
ncbi:MAG: hypothetical protein K8T26_20680 [Lentisphaerae bacterium]|nr:hypothetical protein [Lentisphaerota bacterium]